MRHLVRDVSRVLILLLGSRQAWQKILGGKVSMFGEVPFKKGPWIENCLYDNENCNFYWLFIVVECVSVLCWEKADCHKHQTVNMTGMMAWSRDRYRVCTSKLGATPIRNSSFRRCSPCVGTITFELYDLWPRYLAGWTGSLTLGHYSARS